jgi:hypothetical protein
MIILCWWIAQVGLFAAGMVGPWRDPPERKTNGRLALPFRMALSLSLVFAAVAIWRDADPETAVYARWAAFGMSASFVGDLVMARLIPVPNRLVGGMAAFGIGHALYITAYTRMADAAAASIFNSGLWGALAVYLAVTVVGWNRLIRKPERGAAVNTGALLYGAWIGVMASFAVALATALGGAWWLAAAGGFSFVASDFLTGATEIRGRPMRNSNDWIWATYVAGQMGIVYAGWLAGA